MPKINETFTLDKLREQNRIRARRFYEKNKMRIQHANLSRYYDHKRNLQNNQQT